MAMSEGYAQPIEYIQDRLYLASYSEPPDENTYFPYPTAPPSRSPRKRGSKAHPATSPRRQSPVYFTVDDALFYNAFHADFGPFHIGHLYRFAVHFHEILGDPLNNDRIVVFYSRPDSRSRANAACLLACYMVLIQSWPPHLAIAPISQADPPYMPFRDAGCSQADFVLSIQDVVYGVWKAKEEGLCGLQDFSLEEYEKFERVDMGDFNWITPNFLAFASPQVEPVAPIPPNTPAYTALPSTISEVYASSLPEPFVNVLTHFASRNIGLVVRLNSELYCPSYFTALGINHIDMIFEDGTCPTLSLTRRFIKLAHDLVTNKKKGIAVHCKAGLGRTGCLIGAYLIYRHGFTASEVIAFMRFMRPGMVVGPQQHWLHLNQGSFREWWVEDKIRERLMLVTPITPGRASQKQRVSGNGQMATPPNGSAKRSALGEIDNNEASKAPQPEENLPIPTPGQPRKSARKDSRSAVYSRTISKTDTGLTNIKESQCTPKRLSDHGESDEEVHLQVLAKQRRSPATRSISHSAAIGIYEDVENIGEPGQKPKTPASAKSGSGSLGMSKVRTSPRRAMTDSKGVRKQSGRIGSAGQTTKVK